MGLGATGYVKKSLFLPVNSAVNLKLLLKNHGFKSLHGKLPACSLTKTETSQLLVSTDSTLTLFHLVTILAIKVNAKNLITSY